jgi:xanthine dehydrogenase YagR molybdenum-binding subunit
MAVSDVTVARTYTTPILHNNPLEPHATTDRGVCRVPPRRGRRAGDLSLCRRRFGSKGAAHAHVVLAALAARAVPGRPVKLALTRQQMFSPAGYRTPTIQQVSLAADRSGTLTAVGMDVVEQTSRIKEFAEQTAMPARMMYAAPHRRTTHRLAPLDVPVPSWMRAPGECPGMFGQEVAMDELATLLGIIDPIELRVRNEPDVDPDSGLPFSSRILVAWLRTGAERFGWADRDPRPGSRRDGGWLVGTGVAASVYPTMTDPTLTAPPIPPGPDPREPGPGGPDPIPPVPTRCRSHRSRNPIRGRTPP